MGKPLDEVEKPCEHNWVYKCRETCGYDLHKFEVEVYYCSKCLEQTRHFPER